MEYNRKAAVNYALKWALKRNPEYYDFEEIGGDCTNFTSQCLYAGSGVMNYTPDTGWYYISLQKRSAAWTGVGYLYNFLINNKTAGPYGRDLPLQQAELGDIIQLSFDGLEYTHSLLIVDIGFSPSAGNILIACHTYDSLYRPLDSYLYQSLRLIHIDGVRR